MRRTTIWFIAILAGLAAAAGSLVYAQFDAGYYSARNPGAIMQPVSPKRWTVRHTAWQLIPCTPLNWRPVQDAKRSNLIAQPATARATSPCSHRFLRKPGQL